MGHLCTLFVKEILQIKGKHEPDIINEQVITFFCQHEPYDYGFKNRSQLFNTTIF